MRTVELKYIGPEGQSPNYPFAPAVVTGETETTLSYYRLVRPDWIFTELHKDVVIRGEGK